jgi:hypothetical protein
MLLRNSSVKSIEQRVAVEGGDELDQVIDLVRLQHGASNSFAGPRPRARALRVSSPPHDSVSALSGMGLMLRVCRLRRSCGL